MVYILLAELQGAMAAAAQALVILSVQDQLSSVPQDVCQRGRLCCHELADIQSGKLEGILTLVMTCGQTPLGSKPSLSCSTGVLAPSVQCGKAFRVSLNRELIFHCG